MAFVDVMNFSRSEVSEADGMKIIRSSRRKTGESFVSLFLPEAEEIAEKYDCQLPKISNQKYSDYLKLSGAGAGTGKNITSHAARHRILSFRLKTSKLQNRFLQQVTI
jgi:hypothetical protein